MTVRVNSQDARYFAASLREDIYTIDLHGILSLHTAIEQLEKELFFCSIHDHDVCRVVHGIGSGAMKRAVHAALEASPLIDDFQMSADGGSTIVLL